MSDTPEVIYYTVIFCDYDEAVLKTDMVAAETAAVPPLPPLREGYVFDRWDKDFSCVIEDMTVTAIYRIAPFHSSIKLYDSRMVLLYTVEKVLSATYRETLDGELTLEFSTLAKRIPNAQVGGIAEFEDDYFNIVRVTKSISNGLMVLSVTCEHISYILNDERYKLEKFDFTGEPSEGLRRLLSGTQFSVGTVDFSESVTMRINTKVTRREALMQFIAILGGEIEYEKDRIGIRSHKGSTNVKQLMEQKNVTAVSVTHDSRADTANYDIAFHKLSDYAVGDEVRLQFTPLGFNVQTRIIALEYNPFYRYSIRVEVGSYIPTFNDSLYTVEKEVVEVQDQLVDLETDLGDLTTEFESFVSGFQWVQNITVSDTHFTVTYDDGATNTYAYTVDSQGRMTSITKEG